MLLLIDNYDSFTWNLVQRFGEIAPGLAVEVHRNDQITCDEIAAKAPSHLVVSPGPCTPDEAGISCDAVRRFAGRMPILGVCLGHQSIGQVFGGRIVRADRLMHGKVDRIEHTGQGLFASIAENPIEATRYHSLVIDPPSLPRDFEVDAWSATSDGAREIMAIRHKTLPVYGVQFHPESFLTPVGYDLLRRFLATGASGPQARAGGASAVAGR
jgi:anthranilate synthase/aminodeoxychorismate synthase-like glutamine amidotransferase